MSDNIPTVSMEMNQQMLVAAITEYVQNNMFGRPVEVVNIEFTAGRKANGHTATIDVAFGNGQSATVEVPSAPVKRDPVAPLSKRDAAPEAEETDVPETTDEEDVVDQPDVDEEETEEAPATSKKNLFKS